MGRVQEGINTRDRLADTLLEMCDSVNPNKIKVVDLCRKAHVERQTFYHHFKDIYHLAEFTYDREILKILDEKNLRAAITDNDPHQHMVDVLNALDNSSNGLKRLLFFYSERNQHGHFFNLVKCNLVSGFRQRMLEAHISDERIDKIITLRTTEISSVVISWLRGEIPLNADELTTFIINSSETVIGQLTNGTMGNTPTAATPQARPAPKK
jgi:AcrR family transcriptional regulator